MNAAAGLLVQRMAAEQLISLEEIKKHTNEEDCWLVINGAQLRLPLAVSHPIDLLSPLGAESQQREHRRVEDGLPFKYVGVCL